MIHSGPSIDIYDLSLSRPRVFFVDWKGNLTHNDANTYDGLITVLEMIKEHSWKVMVSGHESMTGISSQIMEFANDIFYPEALNRGLLAEINIEPQNFVSTTAHHRVHSAKDIRKQLLPGQLFMGKATDLDNALTVSNMIIENSPMRKMA